MIVTEKLLAKKINTDATEILALESEKHNSFFLYMSTDYVFDGKAGMKTEEDEPNPINFYGKSKLDGEKVLKKITTPSIIVRTSTPFGIQRNSSFNGSIYITNLCTKYFKNDNRNN